MKSWISVAFGAAALALGTFGAVTPAAARSDVGVYIGHGGAAISIGHHRNRCHNYWYRRNHPYRCGDGRYYRERYYYNDYGYYNDYRYRYRHNYRRHHRHHDHDRRRHRRHHHWD